MSTPVYTASSLPSYDASNPNGGDSLSTNINIYDPGHIAWILAATALVWLMIPAVGFLYAGLTKRTSALTMLSQSLIITAVIAFQWFFWGFSLTFSHSANAFIGDLKNIGLRHVLAAPSVGSSLIPDILLMLYQYTFAACTAELAFGSIFERGRLAPSVLVTFIWATLVYDPIACWTWNPAGWLFKLGGLDFAGGGPVHITSGFSALAYSLVLGPRQHRLQSDDAPASPHSVLFVFLGTCFLWFGWFGFNGGSALGANVRAIYAAANTNLAASMGGLAYMALDRFAGSGKWSLVALCCGSVAGLVGITPAAGFVPIWAAIPIGVITAAACWSTRGIKHLLHIDDGLDIFAIHGVGGFVGCVLTGIFAADYIAATDGLASISGGWISGHYKQLGYQLAGAIAIASYSFGITLLIASIIDRFVPGMQLRHSVADEESGVDLVELGELVWPTDFTMAGRLARRGEKTDLEADTNAPKQPSLPPTLRGISPPGPSIEGSDGSKPPIVTTVDTRAEDAAPTT